MKRNTNLLAGSLKCKTVAITGSTGGLGNELCLQLLNLGANLVLLDRNKEKSDNLKQRLLSLYPDANIKQISLDLESKASVVAAIKAIKAMPIDYIIHNAGAYSIPRNKTDFGFDNVFTINFLAPYIITKELLPDIENRGGKIIAVGSIAHNYSKIDKKDIDFTTKKAASKVYGNAKRYLMYSHLNLNSAGDLAAVAHPGITFTNITAHYPKLIFAIIKHPMKVIFMSPKKAALSIIEGIFTPCGKDSWIGPSLFGIWGRPKKSRLTTADKAEREFIVATADKLYKEIKTHL